MQCSVASAFWYRVAGVENMPVSVGQLQLPQNAKLHVKRFNQSVGMGSLVTLAAQNGTAGIVTQ